MDEKSDEFKIKCYRKSELAGLYMPDAVTSSAVRTLRRWIDRNEELTAKLIGLGYRRNDRIFSVAQVREIVRVLGQP